MNLQDDRYFLDEAKKVSKKSTCLRRQCGAVIVWNNKWVIAQGYNDMPYNCRKCPEIGCLRAELNIPSGQRHELCRAVHAEQNAMLDATMSIRDCTMYVTHQPCVICAKLIINSGIKRIVFENPYPDELSKQLLEEAGVQVDMF